VMVGLCADTKGMGKEVGDYTSITVRHQEAQCAPPLRSERRRGGGADEVPGWCGGTLRMGEVEYARHGLETEGVVVHVHGCKGGGVCVLICHPRCGRLYGVEGL
jgi:hypothetical protein